ncbi:NAD-dependent epimerase/dehydratase family protein [Pseudomarimonas salicorniae]|uniref:Epimerase n=1 Tax=Pseudomarimonas salicorniae TaxID=2933270 RepID=A0ABT0GI17_9GAMM|nr:NAD-dependent epimerase/dehydratase family protein [Lysobacter sp. CAU 1642]MCK7594073.1 epimerase [Lysobacter sp. CAU 1642]
MPSTRRELLAAAAIAAGAGLLPLPLRRAMAEAPPRKLRILILGGTGFTGPAQVRYALARGHHVTLFNRGKRPSPEWPGEVVQLHGDRETGDLKALEDGEWDVCIDNPTSVPHWVRDAGQVLKGKVGQYVYISSISVYRDTSTAGMREDAPLAVYTGEDPLKETRDSLIANMGELFGPLKAACEAEAERWFPGRVTVIRPGYIVGARDETDRFTYWPRRVAEGGEVLMPGDGSDPLQFIDARDLAEWTIRMVERGRTGIFHATGPARPLSTRAFLDQLNVALGGKASFVSVPTGFLREQKVQFGGDLPIWFPAEGESLGFAQIDIRRAVGEGLSFRPLADTVSDLMDWYGSLPPERQANPRAGMSREREAGLIAAWRAANV